MSESERDPIREIMDRRQRMEEAGRIGREKIERDILMPMFHEIIESESVGYTAGMNVVSSYRSITEMIAEECMSVGSMDAVRAVLIPRLRDFLENYERNLESIVSAAEQEGGA